MKSQTHWLAQQLGELLLAKKLKVTVAESCTGGGLARAITAIAGSSQWFEAGFVTYSNRMKSELLGVDPAVIDAHGAVSEAVVRMMLGGALIRAHADIGAAISGIAGPGGATPGKPVGTVCIAVGSEGDVASQTCHFDGDRALVREQSVTWALEKLIRFSARAEKIAH